MDTRNSALVVGLYLAGVVIIVVVSLGYYTYERWESGPQAALRDLEVKRVSPSTHPPSLAPYYHTSRVKADQTLLELRASLAETNGLLEQRNQALNERNSECKALQADLDQSFMLILNLLANEPNNEQKGRESTQQARNKLEAELAKLIESLNQSQVLGAEQERQLAKLRSDLLRTDLELAVVHEQSELEFAALQSDRRSFESVVSEVVVRCGAAAVPALVDRLSDDRIEIRRWAVRVLGMLGPEAQESEPALRSLLSDPDLTVREEARRALALVEGAARE